MPKVPDRATTFDTVFSCASCGGQHRASGSVELRRQPILFGGGGGGVETETPWAGPVTCPRTNVATECHLFVAVEDGEYVRRLVVEQVLDSDGEPPAGPAGSGKPAVPQPLAPQDWITEDLAEWRKNSVATARTYSTTMLTTSSGAVAVYFSVLKYLGFDKINRSWGWLTILPPVLFLGAAAIFAMSMFPALTYVRAQDYAVFRARRINQMHRRATIGTSLYILSVLGSLIIFFAELR